MTVHQTKDGRLAVLRPATAADEGRVLTLLRQLKLPEAGVTDWLPRFTIAESGPDLVGVAGLEQYGGCGLLRSVAVDPAWQRTGLGGALVDRVVDRATTEHLTDLYLLTTTAADYFPRHRFAVIAREDVLPDVQQSVEFKSACPASATVMHRSLS